MSRPHFFIVAALTCSVLSLPGLAGEAESGKAVGRYQVKNRSSFEVKETARTPFWPIGHVKRNRGPALAPIAPTPTTKLSPEMFSVTSILLGNPSLAVINGRAYGEGEFLRLGAPGGARPGVAAPRAATLESSLRVRVIRIVDGLVTLQATDGQSIVVSLRRDEIGLQKGSEQELQLPAR